MTTPYRTLLDIVASGEYFMYLGDVVREVLSRGLLSQRQVLSIDEQLRPLIAKTVAAMSQMLQSPQKTIVAIAEQFRGEPGGKEVGHH